MILSNELTSLYNDISFAEKARKKIKQEEQLEEVKKQIKELEERYESI